VSDQQEKAALPESDADRMPGRMTMVRDVAVFQLKLLADGFRDLLLVPVSIAAAIIALLGKGPKPGPEFYDLLRAGRRSEHWINLFGALDQVRPPTADADRPPEEGIDELVSKVESFVIDEYKQGKVTAQAKQKLDVALQALNKLRRRSDAG
jgi:hypothetical protein